jgi:hypothetical protein
VKKIIQTTLSPFLILAIALALRLAFLQNYLNHHPRQALAALPFLFEPGNIAFSLVGGHGFASPFRVDTGPTAWMTPVWPLLLAAVFRIFGTYTFHAFIATAALNIVFSTLVCWPLFLAGKRIGGRAVAAGAAWLWAVSPMANVLPYESLWEGSLAALLAATLLWATLAVVHSPRTRNWIAYGLLWGIVLMTSATFALLFPLVFGWLAWRTRNIRPALGAGLALLCCLPWTVRNYARFHTLVPLRSVAGLSLWVGNNDRADGLTPNRHPISNSAERAKYINRGEIAYMRDKRNEAVQFMVAHPDREMRLVTSRFIAVWTGGTPAPIADVMRTRSAWFRWVVLFNVVAALLGAAGIVVLFRQRNPGAFPIVVFPLVFPLPYYVTLALPRYRLPIDPVLFLLAALALQAICQTIKRGSSGAGLDVS